MTLFQKLETLLRRPVALAFLATIYLITVIVNDAFISISTQGNNIIKLDVTLILYALYGAIINIMLPSSEVPIYSNILLFLFVYGPVFSIFILRNKKYVILFIIYLILAIASIISSFHNYYMDCYSLIPNCKNYFIKGGPFGSFLTGLMGIIFSFITLIWLLFDIIHRCVVFAETRKKQ